MTAVVKASAGITYDTNVTVTVKEFMRGNEVSLAQFLTRRIDIALLGDLCINFETSIKLSYQSFLKEW